MLGRVFCLGAILVMATGVLAESIQDVCGAPPSAPPTTNATSVTEFEGKLEGKITGALGRIAGGETLVEGSFKEINNDIRQTFTNPDDTQVKMFTIYLSCTTIHGIKDISADQAVQILTEIQNAVLLN